MGFESVGVGRDFHEAPMNLETRMLLARLRTRAKSIGEHAPQLAAALEFILNDEASRHTRLDGVMWAAEHAAVLFDCSIGEIFSMNRRRNVVEARSFAMALCRERWQWSTTTIGRAFERDHTTVSHALRKCWTGDAAALIGRARRMGNGAA